MDGVQEAIDEVIGYDPKALATLLGLGVNTVYERLQSGELPAIRFTDRCWFIPKRLLLDALDSRAQREAEERQRAHQPVKVQPLSMLPPQARPRARSK